ncbi:MAG: hypothetical protein NVS4B9_29610 [Ktedonobacteraceae bacterium]
MELNQVWLEALDAVTNYFEMYGQEQRRPIMMVLNLRPGERSSYTHKLHIQLAGRAAVVYRTLYGSYIVFESTFLYDPELDEETYTILTIAAQYLEINLSQATRVDIKELPVPFYATYQACWSLTFTDSLVCNVVRYASEVGIEYAVWEPEK